MHRRGGSNIERLTPELRQRLHELVDMPGVTGQQVADMLNAEAGTTVVSRAGVNRYAARIRKFAERNKQAREVVKAILDRSGAGGQQDLSEVIVQQLRTVAFDLITRMYDLYDDADADDDGIERAELVGKMLAQASRSARDIEITADRSIERRRRMKAEVADQAAEAATAEARAAGISDATIEAIRGRILGVAS